MHKIEKAVGKYDKKKLSKMLMRIRESLVRQMEIVDGLEKKDVPEKLRLKCKEFLKRFTGK